MDQNVESQANQEVEQVNLQAPLSTKPHKHDLWRYMFSGVVVLIVIVYLGYVYSKRLQTSTKTTLIQPTPILTIDLANSMQNDSFLKILGRKCSPEASSTDLSGTPFKTSRKISKISCSGLDGSLIIELEGESTPLSINFDAYDPEKKKLALAHNLSRLPNILIAADIYGYQEPCEPEIGKDVELHLNGFRTLVIPSGEEILVRVSKKIVEPSDPRLITFLNPYGKEVTCARTNPYLGFDMMQTYPSSSERTIDYDILQQTFANDYQAKLPSGKNSVEELEELLNSISVPSVDNWITYKSARVGFSIEHPSDIQINESTGENAVYFSQEGSSSKSNSTSRLSLRIGLYQVPQGMTLEESIDSDMKNGPTNLDIIDQLAETELNGIRGHKMKVKNYNNQQTLWYLEKRKGEYVIITDSSADLTNDQTYVQTASKMLSTMRLIE